LRRFDDLPAEERPIALAFYEQRYAGWHYALWQAVQMAYSYFYATDGEPTRRSLAEMDAAVEAIVTAMVTGVPVQALGGVDGLCG
jgi:hypothetical protein